MERYKVYGTNKGFAWFLVVIGSDLELLGGVLIILILIGGDDREVSLLSSVTFFVQGVLFA